MNTAAVIVTHNRLSLLKEAVQAVRSQTISPDGIIVVDNGCTDGTREWLESQSGLVVLRQENQGSAGGQASGIEKAVELGAEWIWLMDDDTLPQPAALEGLLGCPRAALPDTGLLASVVRWKDGNLHKMNLLNPAFVERWLGTVGKERCFEILSASFVSIFVHRRAVEAVGLPLRGLFIWGDDIEYTRRITSRLRGYAVLDSEVVHATATNDGAGTQLGTGHANSTKFWCLNRNLIALEYFAGGPWYKVLKRILVRLARQLREYPDSSARNVIIRSAVDGLVFAWKNKSFRLPLHRVPYECSPVCWPACLKRK